MKDIATTHRPASWPHRSRGGFITATLLAVSMLAGGRYAAAVPSLHSKVYHLDIKGVEKLLAQGYGVNKKDGDGRPPLFYCLFPSAAGKTQVQFRVMELLLKSGADVNIADRNGVTPLIEALTYGNIAAAEKLLANGASPVLRENSGSSALHKAAGTAGPDMIKKLVQGGCVVNWKDRSGWTPLHEAAENGNAPVVAELIALGADVNARNEELNTPLHLAVLEESGQAIGDLIAAGADVNARNVDDNTPLFLAMREYGEPAVLILLEKGAMVGIFNKEGITPLHRAAYFGLTAIAGMLLKSGAAADAETPLGVTPMHLAVQWGHKDTVKLLLDAGADVTRKTGPKRNAETALHIAVRNNSKDIVRILLEKGAQPDTPDGEGVTPVQVAMDSSHVELAHFIGSHDKRGEPYYFVISSYPGTGDYFANSALNEGRKRPFHGPGRAFDRNLKTSWISGGAAGADRVAFFTKSGFTKLRIYPGRGSGRREYMNHNRLKRARFMLYHAERHNLQKTGKHMTVKGLAYSRELLFSDEMGYHEFELPGLNGPGGYLGVLEVKEVYRGPRGLTCIAEINPMP